jgi:hypothetical protein
MYCLHCGTSLPPNASFCHACGNLTSRQDGKDETSETASTLPPPPQTANWDIWSTVQEGLSLKSGTDTIALVCDPGDSCNINIDSITITH